MREIIVDKGKKREISIVEKEKYYKFQNICGNKHYVSNGLSFADQEIRDDVDEAAYKIIMKSNWIENQILVELDDDDNPISTTDGKVIQQPMLDMDLIKVMGNQKKLDKYLKGLTIQKKHVLNRMKKLCIDNNLPTNSFLALQTKEKNFENIEIGIIE